MRPTIRDRATAETLGSHDVTTIVRRRAIRRITVIASVVAALLGSTRLAVGAVRGLTAITTVSIAGTTGWWTPTVPTPVAPRTITPTATTTPSVDEPSAQDGPEPTIRS